MVSVPLSGFVVQVVKGAQMVKRLNLKLKTDKMISINGEGQCQDRGELKSHSFWKDDEMDRVCVPGTAGLCEGLAALPQAGHASSS